MASVFCGLPNTSFRQSVAITEVMSRHVVTIGAIILVVCGFLPKIGFRRVLNAERSYRDCLSM